MAKVTRIEAARARRNPMAVFQPDGLEDVVGAVGSTVSERSTHVALKAPPHGSAWAFTPEQAREVAQLLMGFAAYVEGVQDDG